jgi:putative Mg2+ transporter-C (MgtC) family protein
MVTLAGQHVLSFDQLEQLGLTGTVTVRLLLACALGGVIGLDREYHHKSSGVRTNLLICFGAALFTYLSPLIAGELSTNKGQIASNIVQGVGFLGAGLILHNRTRVSGLTSAATVFAVAAIGMTCGAGLYLPAVFSTLLVLLALEAVGALETLSNLKQQTRAYEVRGHDADALMQAVLVAMDEEQKRLETVERDVIGEVVRASFNVSATLRGHRHLKKRLADSPQIERVLTFQTGEDD